MFCLSICVHEHEQVNIANIDWLTTTELLNWLGISKADMYRKIADGLPKIKIGRHVRFAPESIKAWVASQNN